MIVGATVTDVAEIPLLDGLVRHRTAERERPDPLVLAGLLELRPDQCGSDGKRYRPLRVGDRVLERQLVARFDDAAARRSG